MDRGVLLGNKYRIQKTASDITLETVFEFKKKKFGTSHLLLI